MAAAVVFSVSRRILKVQILLGCGVLFSRWRIEGCFGLGLRTCPRLDISSFFPAVWGLDL
jgi:hypothetical protein